MSLTRCFADIDQRVIKQSLTPEDGALLKKYLSEQSAIRSMADQSILTEYQSLIPWSQALSLSNCSITDIYAARNSFKNRKQNTQRVYIVIGKRFFIWRFEGDEETIKKIRAMKVPPPDRMTKTASQMLTPETIDLIVKGARNTRDRAMLSMLYDGGFRPKEIISLTWKDIKVEPHGTIINTDEKTGAPRRVLLVNSAGYLAQWRQDYPGLTSGSSYVFVTISKPHTQIKYRSFRAILKRSCTRAGLDKDKIHLYLFRHSHITACQENGLSDGVNKLIHWGNQHTNMLSTYAHISDTKMDDAVLEMQGIKRERKVRGPAIKPIQCPKCNIVNPTGSVACYGCGMPLTDSAMLEMERVKAAMSPDDMIAFWQWRKDNPAVK
jgi:site-specific recombinase XerD